MTKAAKEQALEYLGQAYDALDQLRWVEGGPLTMPKLHAQDTMRDIAQIAATVEDMPTND